MFFLSDVLIFLVGKLTKILFQDKFRYRETNNNFQPNFTPKYYKDVEYQNRDKNNLHPDIKVRNSLSEKTIACAFMLGCGRGLTA